MISKDTHLVFSIYNAGNPITNPWTRLLFPADVGDAQIVLPAHDISGWKNGDEIIIATTSHHRSQKESETHVIKDINYSVGGNEATLLLEDTLKHNHSGEDEHYGDITVPFRAEVGLLTRNVQVKGDKILFTHFTKETGVLSVIPSHILFFCLYPMTQTTV